MGCKFTRDVHNIRSHLRSFAISSNAIRLHPFPNDTAWGLCSLRCKLDCNFMTSWFPCVCALVVLQGVLGGMVAGVLGALGFARNVPWSSFRGETSKDLNFCKLCKLRFASPGVFTFDGRHLRDIAGASDRCATRDQQVHSQGIYILKILRI